VPLAMGLTKYDLKKFIFFNILASIVWAIIVGLVAYALGQLFLDSIEEYKIYGIVILLLLFFGIYSIFRKN
jgi:membrane protein DedA with SNARE-associated domain